MVSFPISEKGLNIYLEYDRVNIHTTYLSHVCVKPSRGNLAAIGGCPLAGVAVFPLGGGSPGPGCLLVADCLGQLHVTASGSVLLHPLLSLGVRKDGKKASMIQ